MGQCMGVIAHDICMLSNDRRILKKYRMDMSCAGVMGEGSFSICRRGTVLATGENVAIKTYKGQVDETILQQFKRQIAILQELQTPFVQPADPMLWTAQLEGVKADELFMRLVDYSKNAKGQAGPRTKKGELFVVTELGQYDLKQYIRNKKKQSMPPSKETVRDIAMAIVRVVAGLHAKGFVHLDLKPQNLMFFDGRLKLIDVEGCVRIGTNISMDDPHVSFSPYYCAPEWATFITQPCTFFDTPKIPAAPGLDSWSVGCTLCELIALDAIFKPAYSACMQQGKNDQESGMLVYMEWLTQLQEAPVPNTIKEFDAEFLQLISRCFLVCNESKRKTCAESLADPYLAADRLQRTASSPLRTAWPGSPCQIR